MTARVEYIKLPKSYRNGNRDWGMDVISFRLPPELNAKIEQVASKKKITKSELIRMAITKFLLEEEVQ